MKTAATSWQAVNAALTLASLSASVKKDTMAKDYNMNAQVSLMSQCLCFSLWLIQLRVRSSIWGY